MKVRSKGFTIVEVIIVVIVIGILVGMATVVFTQVQKNTRNEQRAADINVIADGLERYYSATGVYPNCYNMTQSASTVASLLEIGKESLQAPTAASGTNSITCSLLSAGSGQDVYGYVGDTTTECTTNTATTFCFEYTLQYREEGTGTIITKESVRCGKDSEAGEAACSRPAS
jgi:prepilin-type N-terminal cleavage/methylation domain-containing protein